MFQRCYHRGGGLYHHRNVSDEKVPGTNQTLTIVSRILLRADDPLAPIVSTELQFARCGWLGLLLQAVKAPPHRCYDNEILIGPGMFLLLVLLPFWSSCPMRNAFVYGDARRRPQILICICIYIYNTFEGIQNANPST